MDAEPEYGRQNSFWGFINLWSLVCLVLAGLVLCPFRTWAADGRLSSWLRTTFPGAVQAVRATHGLTPFDRTSSASGRENPGKRVILIHGLDEPGRIWLNLAPALARKGFDVWMMTYPNDQSIESSARFVYQALAEKGWDSRKKTALVAHSMGGLVARQMLTGPIVDPPVDPLVDPLTDAENRTAYSQGVKAGRVPAISCLIMIGTPNHGAVLARFRLIMEIREQVLNRIHGHGSWLQGIFDGHGEAGEQLLPGSPFLTRLNARPYPAGVSMVVIAGKIPFWRPPGDGLVSLASARLEGIPFYQVAGNHLTMVRNLTRSSARVPPAVPLVVELLSR